MKASGDTPEQPVLVQTVTFPECDAIRDVAIIDEDSFWVRATTRDGHDSILLHDLKTNTSRVIAEGLGDRGRVIPGSHEGLWMWNTGGVVKDTYFSLSNMDNNAVTVDDLGLQLQGFPTVVGILEGTDLYLMSRDVDSKRELVLRNGRHESLARVELEGDFVFPVSLSPRIGTNRGFFIVMARLGNGKSRALLCRETPFELVTSIDLPGSVLHSTAGAAPTEIRVVMHGGPHRFVVLGMNSEQSQPTLSILKTHPRPFDFVGERDVQWTGQTLIFAMEEPPELNLFTFDSFVSSGQRAPRSKLPLESVSSFWGFSVDERRGVILTWEGNNEVKLWAISRTKTH